MKKCFYCGKEIKDRFTECYLCHKKVLSGEYLPINEIDTSRENRLLNDNYYGRGNW